MALTSSQSSLSDLFAARGAGSRVSSTSRRRNESASSGDFGAIFASASAKPASKATAKSATSHVEKSSDRSNRSTRKSNVNSASKSTTAKHEAGRRVAAKTSTPKDKNTAPVSKHNGAAHHQVKSNIYNSEGKAAVVKNAIERVDSSIRNGAQAPANVLLSEVNSANMSATKLQATQSVNGSSVELFTGLNSASDSVGSFAGDGLLASSTFDASMAAGSEELTAKMFGQSGSSTGASGAVGAKSLETFLSGSSAGPNTQNSIGPIGQTASLAGGTDLRSIGELIRDFDAKSVADNGANTESKLGADNLKALEQLNSVKLVAPTVVRALMSQKPERMEVITKSQTATQQGMTGTVQIPGITASNAIELVNVVPQNTTLSKEFFALQQGGLDEGIKLDGKSASLEALTQLQAERNGTREANGAKSSKVAGKLVVPEKFGSMLKSGVQSLRLQIAPKHLGTAELTVKLIRDHVQGTLTVTSEAAKVAALNSMDSLADRLSAEGLVLDSLDVEVSQDGFNQGQNELERQYSDVLQSGLIHRALESSDEFSQPASVSEAIAPWARNVVNAGNVDTHA